MNAFNRVVAVLVFLGLLVVFIIGAILPFQVLAALRHVADSLYAGLSEWYFASPMLFRVSQAAIVLAAILVWGTLLWLEVRRGKPRTVQVVTAEGGKAEVLVDSVALRLSYYLDQLADVINVTPQVRSKGNVVHVAVDVETTPDVDVPMKTQEIMHVIREVVEERMGLRLGRVDVRIKHAPFPQETGEPRVTGSAG